MRFSNLSFAVDAPQLHPIIGEDAAAALVITAYGESLLQGPDNEWFGFASVQKALVYQAMMMGDLRRNFGGISFMTHLIEVADRVYNCPELHDYEPESRAIIPIAHDLEDICKKFQVNAQLVLEPVAGFIDHHSEACMQLALKELFVLMDPLNVVGKEREELQFCRIGMMGELAIYTRLFDKICTYERDLLNMRTVDPRTGMPFLSFDSGGQADAYIEKMHGKGRLVKALPVTEIYKTEWCRQCLDIEYEIKQQLAGLDVAKTAPLAPRMPDHSLAYNNHLGHREPL